MRGLRTRLAEPLAAFGGMFANRGLRRLQIAFTASEFGDWGAMLALSVVAFSENGAAGLGALLLVRMLPAALAAPFTSVLGDRLERVRVMVGATAIRAAAMAGCAAVAFADAPLEALYALAAVIAVAATAFRPAQAAILPSLARTPGELTAANVASSTIESVTSFAAPAVGGVVLAATEPGVSFAVAAAAYLLAAGLVSLVRPQRADAFEARRAESVLRTVTAGARAILADPRVRLLVGVFGAQTVVAGALNVLVVVVALDLLETGERGLGTLNAALGVGGLLGAVGAIGLVGRRRLATAFGVGTVIWGAPLAVIAVLQSEPAVIALLGVIGLANTVVDVAGFTILQRTVPDDVLARVFGILESVFLGTIALGGLVASVLVETVGTTAALVAAGAFLPAVVVFAWPRIVAIDAAARVPVHELALLRGVPFLSVLPGTTLEDLALRLVPVSVAAGEAVVIEREAGDRFYVVADGELAVTRGGEHVTGVFPGGYFGEIALLRDVPRTATVTASSDASLLALERDDFIAAVTGHAPSADAAGAVVAARLGALRQGIGPLR